jgi:hypothetical protein
MTPLIVKQPGEEGKHRFISARIALNRERTGHPFHHKTADGTMVDAGPSLEEAIASLRQTLPAVPVNRTFYGFAMYRDDRAKRLLDDSGH